MRVPLRRAPGAPPNGNGHARIGSFLGTARSPESRDCSRIRTSSASRESSQLVLGRARFGSRNPPSPPLGRARPTFGGAMPPKKKKAAPPKKEEAVPALSEEERLVLAQAEALKVRGGSGRASFSRLSRVCLKRRIRTPRAIPPFSPRAVLADPRSPPAAHERTRARTNTRVLHRRRKRRRSPRTKLGFVICGADARRNIRERKRTIS